MSLVTLTQTAFRRHTLTRGTKGRGTASATRGEEQAHREEDPGSDGHDSRQEQTDDRIAGAPRSCRYQGQKDKRSAAQGASGCNLFTRYSGLRNSRHVTKVSTRQSARHSSLSDDVIIVCRLASFSCNALLLSRLFFLAHLSSLANTRGPASTRHATPLSPSAIATRIAMRVHLDAHTHKTSHSPIHSISRPAFASWLVRSRLAKRRSKTSRTY